MAHLDISYRTKHLLFHSNTNFRVVPCQQMYAASINARVFGSIYSAKSCAMPLIDVEF